MKIRTCCIKAKIAAHRASSSVSRDESRAISGFIVRLVSKDVAKAITVGAMLLAKAQAQNSVSVEYLCCDWGPVMTLPAKTNEVAHFNDAEDEVYFLKQVRSQSHKEVGIFLCKMKADGSGKTAIKELWHNPNYPIDTQAQSTWMDVNRKTRKVALSVTYGGSDITGLWTVNLDGSGLRRLTLPIVLGGKLQRVSSPSWTPDGEWIVFRSETDRMHLMRCDKNGEHISQFELEGDNLQPRVSPDGKIIVFEHIGDDKTGGLYLMNFNGSNIHPLSNPNDKGKTLHAGTSPAWSPDGGKLYFINFAENVVEVDSGKQIWIGVFQPRPGGWSHWGKNGLVGFALFGITVSNFETKQSRLIAAPRIVNEKFGLSRLDHW